MCSRMWTLKVQQYTYLIAAADISHLVAWLCCKPKPALSDAGELILCVRLPKPAISDASELILCVRLPAASVRIFRILSAASVRILRILSAASGRVERPHTPLAPREEASSPRSQTPVNKFAASFYLSLCALY